jgi:hypothetical protein
MWRMVLGLGLGYFISSFLSFLQQLRPFRYLLRLEDSLSPDSAVPWYNPTTAESVCIVPFACA